MYGKAFEKASVGGNENFKKSENAYFIFSSGDLGIKGISEEQQIKLRRP